MATPHTSIVPDVQQAPQTAEEHLHWTLIASSSAVNIAGVLIGDRRLSPSVRQRLSSSEPRILDALLSLHQTACTMIGCEWMAAATFEAATEWLGTFDLKGYARR